MRAHAHTYTRADVLYHACAHTGWGPGHWQWAGHGAMRYPGCSRARGVAVPSSPGASYRPAGIGAVNVQGGIASIRPAISSAFHAERLFARGLNTESSLLYAPPYSPPSSLPDIPWELPCFRRIAQVFAPFFGRKNFPPSPFRGTGEPAGCLLTGLPDGAIMLPSPGQTAHRSDGPGPANRRKASRKGR